MRFRDTTLPAPVVARQLGVEAVIEGAVSRAGDRIRLSVRLLHVDSDRYVWARQYEGDVAHMASLGDEVSRAVAEATGHGSDAARWPAAAPVRVVAPEAVDEYLLGRHLLWRVVAPDREKAIAHFTRAIEIDPDYAAPYAALAHAWWMQAMFGPLSSAEGGARARRAARQALALDPNLAEAYAAEAYVQAIFEWDWPGGERAIRQGIERNPNSVEAHYVYALILMALGRHAEAVAEIDRAARLDPLSPQVQSTYGRVLYRARRYEEAIPRLLRAIELEPRNTGTHARLGAVYLELDRYDEARAAYDRVRGLATADGRPVPMNGLAHLHARVGNRAEALRLLDEVGDDPWAAVVHAALGDADTAFSLLLESIRQRRVGFPYVKSEPGLAPLHADPRWMEVLRLMNLPVDGETAAGR